MGTISSCCQEETAGHLESVGTETFMDEDISKAPQTVFAGGQGDETTKGTGPVPETDLDSDKPIDALLPGPVQEFMLALERPVDTRLGALFDSSGGQCLHVAMLQENDGFLAASNRKYKHTRQLRAGDYIMEVSGITCDATAMLTKLQEHPVTQLRVRRPMEFSLSVKKKANSSLGCGISYDASCGSSLVIDAIHEGTIREWNEAHVGKPNQVRPHDRIVAVNGVRGSAMQLLESVRAVDGKLDLVMSRPSGH
mmetsp:Transcript_17299/g.39165  ORF Transcript_17299/g.39165 Transcript_17299/m.39165 type:complete len:253 (-) Transcript_17299:56-814(-)